MPGVYESRIDAFINEDARKWRCEDVGDIEVWHCHNNLPVPYHETPLIRLPSGVAAHCEVGAVVYKDESARFENASFKPLGAVWACYKTICAGLGLPTTTPFREVAAQLATRPFHVTLHAASDGRWGQAVCAVAKWFGINARIYAPASTSEDLKAQFRTNAELVIIHGDFHDAYLAALRAVRNLNREAEKKSDPDIMPILEAVGWKYNELMHDNDAAPNPTSFDSSIVAENEELKTRGDNNTPHVNAPAFEEEDKHDLSQLNVTIVEEAGSKDSDTTDQADNVRDTGTNVPDRTENAEEIYSDMPSLTRCAGKMSSLVNEQSDQASMNEPVSVRAMTPLSEMKWAHLLVQDNPSHGYERIPSLVVEGYRTMMFEIDKQVHELFEKGPDMIIVPVGAGSLAQAVVSYFKGMKRKTYPVVVTVEPKTAACLQTSLIEAESTMVDTKPTRMSALNRDEVSSLAWPILRNGVDIAMTVADQELAGATYMLGEAGLRNHGPCSASTLAALFRIRPSKHPYIPQRDKPRKNRQENPEGGTDPKPIPKDGIDPRWITTPFGLGSESVVVLIGTEASEKASSRESKVPAQ